MIIASKYLYSFIITSRINHFKNFITPSKIIIIIHNKIKHFVYFYYLVFLSHGTFFDILSFFVFDHQSYFFYIVFDNLLLILCYLYNILLLYLICFFYNNLLLILCYLYHILFDNLLLILYYLCNILLICLI